MRVLAFAGAKVRNKSETTKFSSQKVKKNDCLCVCQHQKRLQEQQVNAL